jgi:hypothetical protein
MSASVVAVLLTLVVILVICVVALFISQNKLWIELKAMKQSTHQITYLNPLSEFTKLSDEDKKKLTFDPLKENI